MTTPGTAAAPFRVSVALCTFNGARFLADQLESIVRQTRPVDEIVICDDGSTDGTAELLRRFQAASPAVVRCRVNPRRLGVTKNFEQAIRLCTGDVIFLCDQDDLWRPDKVAALLARFSDQRVGLAFSNAEVVNEDLSPAGYRLWDSIWFDARERRLMHRGDALGVLLRHSVAAGTTLAFRSRFLPLVLPIPDLPHSHDIWLSLLIACAARLDPLDQDLIRYRLHSSNVVGMRRHGLFGQIRMARRQVETRAFAFLAELHAAAAERLANVRPAELDPEAIPRLKRKVRHSAARDRLPVGRLARLPCIVRELRDYFRYSYGIKSVLQDLFLR